MPYQTVESPCYVCNCKGCAECAYRVYGIRGADVHILDDVFVENLWRECEDIAWAEDEDGELVLDQNWRNFPVGEFTQDDWFHWVDNHHSKGVGWVYENISPYDFDTGYQEEAYGSD